MAGTGERRGGIDEVVKEAAEQNDGNQESEFDTIARYRGQAQDKMNSVLLGGGGHQQQQQQHRQQANNEQDSELDTIAKYRGQAQDKMNSLLLGHLHGGGGEHGAHNAEGSKPGSGTSQQLHESSEGAKDRVLKANDGTYNPIKEVEKSVKNKLEGTKQD